MGPISGDLGADGGGLHVASEYASGPMVGYMTSVCQAGDPSVNHLFIIDGSISPSATHTFDTGTNSDNDSVSGIGAGSPVLYILYSSTSGGCHSDAEHRAIFEAAVATLIPCPYSGQPMCVADASGIEAAIVSPYTISCDANDSGQIQDGGGDMYDGGNRISTSLCSDRLSPYTDNMDVVSSECFGSGGSYMMDIRNSMMVLLTQNSGTAELTVSISGNLGADGGGTHVTAEYSSGSLTAYMTSVCAAGDPSVNHLWVVDGSVSPNLVCCILLYAEILLLL